MRRPAGTAAPVLDRLRLHDLEPASADELGPGVALEGRSLEDAELSGADLTGLVLSECSLSGVAAHETVLRAARLLETRIERMNAPVLDLARATLRDVEAVGSRIGALDVYEASLSAVRFTGCTFHWINLRGAALENVLFEDCTLEEIDLGGASAARLAFEGCRADRLDVAGSRLEDVDLRGLRLGEVDDVSGLRGATLDAARAVELAEVLAAHLGIRIEG